MVLASGNLLHPEGLDRLVQRARAGAEANREDPDYPGLPEPTPCPDAPAFDPDTAEYSPEARARAVAGMCRRAAERNLTASGAFSTGATETSVANSLGLFAYHAGTGVDFQTVVMSEDSSGRAQSSAWRVGDIPVESLGWEAIQTAEQGRNPRPVDPGAYTVVLTPYATEDLLMMLNYHGMGARSVLEGRSWMNDRLGEQVMSELVDIWDDGLALEGIPMPFDFEGVPRNRVDIVRNGVVHSPVHDRLTARKMGERTTGHARPATMRTLGPIATNLFLAPGTPTTEELIRSTRRGLYVCRFWYTRLVHPRACVITGMTRDGVFAIENGELSYPVRNLRFTQSYVDAMANLELVGRETRLLGTEFGGSTSLTPAAKINGFTFTGSTV
jgi:predicted Zn-dependent protease